LRIVTIAALAEAVLVAGVSEVQSQCRFHRAGNV